MQPNPTQAPAPAATRALCKLVPLAACCAALLTAAAPTAPTRLSEADTKSAQMPDARVPATTLSPSGYDLTPLTPEEIETLSASLTQAQRRVLLSSGTEPPFCGGLLEEKEPGIYVCALGDLPLFRSAAKFDSGTGWPSFFEPFDATHIVEVPDHSHGMARTEIRCARSGAHLGHVFEDGPAPTGRRYCLNSAALRFYPDGAALPPGARPVPTQTAYFAGGCFWGVEDRLAAIDGVLDAVSGYQGGATDAPTYNDVCSGATGHTESVRVVFNPAIVTYNELLEAFFKLHNPTTRNRQGPDIGTQYRSAVFTVGNEQRAAAEAYIERLASDRAFNGRPIVTQVVDADAAPFYEAEAYHQDYHLKHGGSCQIGGGR